MPKTNTYRAILADLDDWDAYLQAESGLPGPRGNLELAQAVADVGNPAIFQRYAAITAEEAPSNTPGEFLAFCGVVGLGRLVAEGHHELLPTLRHHASDPRWRLREAVAMALQRLGDADMDRLLAEMRCWAQGSPLEQRAAAAALCEPRLLAQPAHARATLDILDAITASIPSVEDRRKAGAAPGPGLLLERGRGRPARRRPADDGGMAGPSRPGRSLDHAREPEKGASDAHGRSVGGEVQAANWWLGRDTGVVVKDTLEYQHASDI